MSKKALVLVNVGTPDKPEVKYVRKYLSQFLNDRRVIDIPWLLQKILVNLIIVPFRAPKSTKLYQRLWTFEGSPLLIYLNNLSKKLQARLKDEYDVYGTMRYGNPSLKKALLEIKDKSYEEIAVLPLYPQYASSTTLSVTEYVDKITKNWINKPTVRYIQQFYDHPMFVESFVNAIKEKQPKNYDHIVFSYHGLPVRQINKHHPKVDFNSCQCHLKMPEHGKTCYKATCYETSRILAKKLNLTDDQYSVSFQSRLSNNWLTPFTDETLIKLAEQGKKNVLVAAPAFVADCLETTVEIGFEYKELFDQKGGKELTMVESLNDRDDWVDAIVDIVEERVSY